MRFVYFLLPRAELGSQKGESRTSGFISDGVLGDDFVGGSELRGIGIPVYPFREGIHKFAPPPDRVRGTSISNVPRENPPDSTAIHLIPQH
jgi:hypothetical protein